MVHGWDLLSVSKSGSDCNWAALALWGVTLTGSFLIERETFSPLTPQSAVMGLARLFARDDPIRRSQTRRASTRRSSRSARASTRSVRSKARSTARRNSHRYKKVAVYLLSLVSLVSLLSPLSPLSLCLTYFRLFKPNRSGFENQCRTARSDPH